MSYTSNGKKCRIAVLLSGINEEYQRQILDGIMEFAARVCYDVYIFTSFGEGVHAHSHDLGEINIFNLPDLATFDGVILLSNTIQMHIYKDDFFETVSKLKIPVVDIDNELANGYCVEINNETAMRRIIEHFTDHHGFTRINFVSGFMANPEARSRLKAYKDVLGSRNIPLEEDRIFYGNFIRENGYDAVRHFMNSSLPFPEAIICANDNMALGVHMALIENGYRVPEDVCVSGFDNISAAENLSPQLTTVSRPLFEVGQIACKKIYEHINGIATAKRQTLESTPIFSETCGCPKSNNKSTRELLYEEYAKNNSLHNFITRINQMSQSLTESASENIVEVLQPYIQEIDSEAFYICLCCGWNEFDPNSNDESYLVRGYTEEMEIAVACENGKFVEKDNIMTKNLIPQREENLRTSDCYIISPLHFCDRCLGYTVTCNGDFPQKSLLYHSWLMNIANYLENFRKQRKLEKMISKLDALYIRDSLTGLYNRRGFFRFSSELYDRSKQSSIAFFDLDGLKKINDNLGHECGDVAIKTFASVLASISSETIIPARFGGDEFVVFCTGGEDRINALCNSVAERLDAINKESNNPYSVETSFGIYTTQPDNRLTLDECIENADGKMYRNKYMKKKR